MSRSQPRRKVLVATIVVLSCLVTFAVCCDTPVYRFAMYNWAPTPYEVYYFYQGEVPKEDRAINESLKKLAEGDTRTNLAFLPFDLADDPGLTKTPLLPQVKAAWLKDNKSPTKGYMIVGPKGAVLHRGALAAKDLKGMSESKQRTQLAKHLEQGHACVFLMLPGKDAAQNAKVRKELDRVVKDVNSGKLSLYTPPPKGLIVPGTPPVLRSNDDKKSEGDKKSKKAEAKDSKDSDKKKTDGKKAGEKDKPKTEVSLIVLDPKSEPWLIRNLLSLEDDLKDLSDPMVFPVYGRARSLLPMVGRGVNYDNLVAAVEFVSGACSCEIKDENPGVDLLVHYDWEAAAGKVADKFGKEEGNENRFAGDDLFPEILIPSSPKKDPKLDPQTVADLKKEIENNKKKAPDKVTLTKLDPEKSDQGKAQAPDSKADDPTKSDDKKKSASTETAKTDGKQPSANSSKGKADPAEKNDPDAQVAMSSKPDDDAPNANSDQASVGGIMIVGAGIGLALLLLMVATMVIMRPR